MKNSIIHRLICLGLCAMLFAWVSPVHGIESKATIRINGSGCSFALMKPLIDAYRSEHPQQNFELENPLGSSGAIKALLAGALDFAVSSRPLRPGEREQGATTYEYGRTPLLIVTEHRVPKSDISTRELENIYAGRVRTWIDGERIRVVLRPKDDSDTAILNGFSPGLAQALETARAQPGMIVAETDPESNALIARLPGAIGAAALCGLKGDYLPLNVLSLNGIPGTPATLADGSYPLAKSLHLVTSSETSAAARKFLDFIHSPQGRKIAEEAGVLVNTGKDPAQ